jgi:hypothetical protein
VPKSGAIEAEEVKRELVMEAREAELERRKKESAMVMEGMWRGVSWRRRRAGYRSRFVLKRGVVF